MELPSYFTDFLKAIRPTTSQSNDLQSGHQTLRRRLREDAKLSPIIVSDFLQGSYRRSTAVRPRNGKRSDVDIIVVTRLSEDEYTPDRALREFEPFLEKHYAGKWEFQGRSIGIELSYVDLDLVITSAPSESEMGILKSASVRGDDTPETWIPIEARGVLRVDALRKAAQMEPEWKSAPLRIPDRDAKQWQDTDPLAQIEWTWEKNRLCNGHYVNVVKAIKWWRRSIEEPKYPRGYPVEHLIGVCCPEGITSVDEGVTLTLEAIASQYQDCASAQSIPSLADHGVPGHNVMGRVSGEDFAAFHAQVREAASTARRALEASGERETADAWRELFGKEFPEAPEDRDGGQKTGGFTPRTAPTIIGGGRFA